MLARESRFHSKSGVREASVFDCDATAEHHGHAYARPCFERHDPGHSRTPRADAGVRSPLVAGNGSCGNWNADRWREIFAQNREQNAPRSRSRRILTASAGMAGQTLRNDDEAVQEAWLFMRMVARALY